MQSRTCFSQALSDGPPIPFTHEWAVLMDQKWGLGATNYKLQDTVSPHPGAAAEDTASEIDRIFTASIQNVVKDVRIHRNLIPLVPLLHMPEGVLHAKMAEICGDVDEYDNLVNDQMALLTLHGLNNKKDPNFRSDQATVKAFDEPDGGHRQMGAIHG